MRRGYGGWGRGGGGGGWGSGSKPGETQFDPRLFPIRGTPVLKQTTAASTKYLIEQYQNFVIELQSSVFFVGDHQNDEIQRYSDRGKLVRSHEFAALPAWVPDGERHKYMPRDLLLWLEDGDKQNRIFSSKTDTALAQNTEYGQMLEEWRLQAHEASDSEQSDGYEDDSDEDDVDDDESDEDNEYSKARVDSDGASSDDEGGPMME